MGARARARAWAGVHDTSETRVQDIGLILAEKLVLNKLGFYILGVHKYTKIVQGF